MTFGEKIKKARIEAGYTQDELAHKLTVSRAAIAKWESDRGMPDVTNLKMISRSLAHRITEKKFEIGDREFMVMGKV